DRGVTLLNIVAGSIKESGEMEEKNSETIDKLFKKGEIAGSYDVVRKLPDGRIKAEIASKGCLVSASAYQEDTLRIFVDILLENCNQVLKNN
ncbi:hypothetical protein ACFL2D_02715, partial [Patescibacteria group bacterium]